MSTSSLKMELCTPMNSWPVLPVLKVDMVTTIISRLQTAVKPRITDRGTHERAHPKQHCIGDATAQEPSRRLRWLSTVDNHRQGSCIRRNTTAPRGVHVTDDAGSDQDPAGWQQWVTERSAWLDNTLTQFGVGKEAPCSTVVTS
jgi:hypothetical protein